MVVQLLVVPGSTRTGAFSKSLAAAVPALLPAEVKAKVVDLRDHAMPLYDQDLEEASGLPEGALSLRQEVLLCDAVLFVSPEYNSSIPAVLKNAIDWLSRPHAPEPDVRTWAGKVAGLLASSPGALGGLRGLVHLRQILMNVGMQVVTEQFALGGAHQAFDESGQLAEERAAAGVQKVLNSVARMAKALQGAG
ncbi:MAG: NADPH-dependent FMN reductase [Planctomycetota bacterium]